MKAEANPVGEETYGTYHESYPYRLRVFSDTMFMMAAVGIPKRYRHLLEKLTASCRKHLGNRLISLAVFGSVARGSYTPDSDVDLLMVVSDLPQGRFKRAAVFEPIEREIEAECLAMKNKNYNVSLSPVLKTPEETAAGSTLFFDMTSEAILLHDTNHFLADAFSRLRDRLDKLGAKRVSKGSRWYWMLKPDIKPGEVFEI